MQSLETADMKPSGMYSQTAIASKLTSSQNLKKLSALVLFLLLVFIIVATQSKRTVGSTHFSRRQKVAQAPRDSYEVVVVADMDKMSRVESYQWKSSIRRFQIVRDPNRGTYNIYNGEETDLEGKYAEGGRGLELSELQFFNGKLYTCDDRTGIVYEILREEGGQLILVPRHVLTDGDGNSAKGFKCEWMTVKDDVLYVGGIGKEWTTAQGEIVNYNPMWIKTIDRSGVVRSVNWYDVFQNLRKATGTEYPGYLVHEAVSFHEDTREWFFLPRRLHNEMYDEEDELVRGSNTVIVADESLSDFGVSHVGTVTPTRGFSSFKFLPGRPTEIVALKSEENGSEHFTYLAVFDIATGKVLLEETKIGNYKYEGIEVIEEGESV